MGNKLKPKDGEIWEAETGIEEHSLILMCDGEYGYFLDCSDQRMMLYGGPRLMAAAKSKYRGRSEYETRN